MLRFDECGSRQKVEAYLLGFGSPNDLVVGSGQVGQFFQNSNSKLDELGPALQAERRGKLRGDGV